MDDYRQQHSPPWETGTRLICAVLLIAVAGLLLYRLQVLVKLLILAFLISYLLYPLVHKIQRGLKLPRWLAVLLVYVVLLALLVGAGTGAGVAISQSVIAVFQALGSFVGELPAFVEQLFAYQVQLGPFELDLTQYDITTLLDQLTNSIQDIVIESGTILASVVGQAASAVGLFFTVIVFGFYLMMDFDTAQERFLTLVPKPYQPDLRRLFNETGILWSAFFRGQLILGLAVGGVTAVILTILGTNFALGLGVIAGVLEFIPWFGPVIAAVFGILVALFQVSNWLGLSPFVYTMVVLGAFVLIQQLENNLLVPKIIGHSLKMHPLSVLLAILAGASLAGFWGVILAAPAVATLRLWVGYIYRKTVGMEIWPEPIMEVNADMKVPRPDHYFRNVQKRWQQWWADRLLRRKARAAAKAAAKKTKLESSEQSE